MLVFKKFLHQHPLSKLPSPSTRLLIFIELTAVIAGFRLLDKASYLTLFHLGILPEHPAVTMKLVFLLSTISTVALIVFLALMQRLRKRGFEEFGLARKFLPSPKQAALVILAAAIFQALDGEVIDPWLERILNVPKTVPEVKNITELLVSCFVAIIGGGLREEIFFRGYITARIRSLLNPLQTPGLILAMIAQITLFGFAHWYQGPAGVIETAFLAIACTTVYLATGSLWSAILFHGFFDVFGFCLIYFGF